MSYFSGEDSPLTGEGREWGKGRAGRDMRV